MASVIRNLCALPGHRSQPSWFRERPWRSALAAARTAVALLLGRDRAREVVHVHLSTRGSFVREGGLLFLAHRRGYVVGCTLHGGALADFAQGGLRRRLVRGVLGAADVVFALTDEHASLARDLLPSADVRVVCNPLDARMWEPSVPLTQVDSNNFVFFAGDNTALKGLDTLLAAWSRLPEQPRQITLVVAGPLGEATPTDVPNVQVLGPLDPDALLRYLDAALFVVLPSRVEVLPMILLEAMARGKAFLAAPVGGIGLLLASGAGLAVPPGDVEALVAGLCRLLESADERASMGRAGRGWALVHATAGAVDDAMRDAYGAHMFGAGRSATG
jgi:glycosyltransferase involved in cell wall biosynthesis